MQSKTICLISLFSNYDENCSLSGFLKIFPAADLGKKFYIFCAHNLSNKSTFRWKRAHLNINQQPWYRLCKDDPSVQVLVSGGSLCHVAFHLHLQFLIWDITLYNTLYRRYILCLTNWNIYSLPPGFSPSSHVSFIVI